MFLFFYNIAIQFYAFTIRVASVSNAKAKLWIEGRKNILKHIGETLKPDEKRIWIHCASVGEFEQGRPVIEKLKQEYPEHKIVLTFFSPSGFELRKNYELADYVFYLPLDTKKNAEQFISLVNPSFVIFVKYEFWFHYLHTLHQKNIPAVLISANFRSEQIFFKWYGKTFLQMLGWFKKIFVQNKNSFALLEDFNILNVELSHDTRFDRVHEIAKTPAEFSFIKNFCNEKKLLICGSTWQADEHIIIRWINEEMPKRNDWKVIIVPHEINEAHLVQMLGNIQPPAILYSQAGFTDLKNWRVLIVDNVGMLSSLYSHSTISYIGGGFGKGIHNILEAAVFGKPVLFGPRYKKFNEAKELLKNGGAFSVSSYGKFLLKFIELTENKNYFDETSLVAKSYIENNIGATNQVLEFIKKEMVN